MLKTLVFSCHLASLTAVTWWFVRGHQRQGSQNIFCTLTIVPENTTIVIRASNQYSWKVLNFPLHRICPRTYGVGVCEVSGVCEPAAEVIVRWASSNIVNHECSCSTSIIRASHRPETLLSRRIPNLKFYLLSRHLNYARTKLDPDRVWAVGHNW